MLALAPTRVSLRAPGAATSRQPAPHAPRAVSSSRARGRALHVVSFREDDRAKNDLRKRANRAGNELRGRGQQGREGLERAGTQNSPQLYLVNAAALALAAGVAAYSPELAAKVLISPGFADVSEPTSLLVPLVRLLSLGLSAAAVNNLVQSGGAAEDELDSTLHERLNASLSTFSIAQLALLGYSGSTVLNTTGIVALSLGVGLQLFVAATNYARNSPEGYNAVADAKSWLRDASNTFSGIDGGVSAGYALLTASLLAAGMGYLLLPAQTLLGVFGEAGASAGPGSIVVWQLVGMGVSMIAAPITYSLKEAAAENSLSDGRYKLLNIALLTAGLGHWLVLGPRLGSSASSGILLPVVLGTWAIAALLGGVNLLQRPRSSR